MRLFKVSLTSYTHWVALYARQTQPISMQSVVANITLEAYLLALAVCMALMVLYQVISSTFDANQRVGWWQVTMSTLPCFNQQMPGLESKSTSGRNLE